MSVEKTYNFKVVAADEKKCLEAVTAASKLVKLLPHDDLVYLAELAEKKPNFVQKAKPYVNML